MRLLRLSAIALNTVLCACVTPPTLEQQQQTIVSRQLGLASHRSATLVPSAWWSAFGDPQFDGLMQLALANNPTLAQAMARVREAQSLADVAWANMAPAVAFDVQEIRERLSSHDPIPRPFNGTKQWLGRATLNLSWDIDFWGHQASLLKQARSRSTASALDAVSAQLALSGAVAQAYVNLYRNNALADVAQRTEAQRQRILEITRHRVKSGLDTTLELREASAAVPEANVELLQARAAMSLDIHQLAALSGRGAEAYALVLRPTLDPAAILPLPVELPSDLLARRPDLLAARDRIEGARAGQAAVKAEFYPDVNLIAFAGSSAVGLGHLFKANSAVYGAGPAIHLPIFDAGRLRGKYRGAAAVLDEAIASYNQSVLLAVQETADQLSLIETLGNQIVEQQRSLDDAEAAYQLAEERYRAGLSNYLSVLATETAVLGARREHLVLVSDQAIARINLLLAVGGSFDPGAP